MNDLEAADAIERLREMLIERGLEVYALRAELRGDRDRLKEALTRAAENLKASAEFHACDCCKEGYKQARSALAVARTVEKYGGAMAELAKESGR
jgi:hypothetical protein